MIRLGGKHLDANGSGLFGLMVHWEDLSTWSPEIQPVRILPKPTAAPCSSAFLLSTSWR